MKVTPKKITIQYLLKDHAVKRDYPDSYRDNQQFLFELRSAKNGVSPKNTIFAADLRKSTPQREGVLPEVLSLSMSIRFSCNTYITQLNTYYLE